MTSVEVAVAVVQVFAEGEQEKKLSSAERRLYGAALTVLLNYFDSLEDDGK